MTPSLETSLKGTIWSRQRSGKFINFIIALFPSVRCVDCIHRSRQKTPLRNKYWALKRLCCLLFISRNMKRLWKLRGEVSLTSDATSDAGSALCCSTSTANCPINQNRIRYISHPNCEHRKQIIISYRHFTNARYVILFWRQKSTRYKVYYAIENGKQRRILSTLYT